MVVFRRAKIEPTSSITTTIFARPDRGYSCVDGTTIILVSVSRPTTETSCVSGTSIWFEENIRPLSHAPAVLAELSI